MTNNVKTEEIRNKRHVCIKQMERVKEFATLKAETATSAELKIRKQALETAFEVFSSLQVKLENADPEELEKDERSIYEELYYTIHPALQTLLEKGAKASPSDERTTKKNSAICDTIKLPKAHIPTFTGTITEWMSFFDAFNSLVHSQPHLSNVSKFHHLRGSLDGSAALIVKSLEVTDANYQVAIKMLQERYENKKVIAHEHLKQLFDAPPTQKSSASSLRNLLDTFNVHLRALSSLGHLTQHWDDLIVYIMASKLDAATLTKWQEEAPVDRLATYQEMSTYLIKRSQILEGMVSQTPTPKVSPNHKVDNRNKNPPKSFAITNNTQCAHCSKSGHMITRCFRFLRLSPDERNQQTASLKLCQNCLKVDHDLDSCTSSNCRSCGLKHHSLLHRDVSMLTSFNPNAAEYTPPPASSPHNPAVHSVFDTIRNETSTILATAIIYALDYQGSPVACRVLLDSGSQINIVNEQFAQRIGSVRTKTNQSYTGITSVTKHAFYKAFFSIKSRLTSFSSSIEAVILPKITGFLPTEKINTSVLGIPSNISLADPNFQIPQKIDLLLGAELFFSLLLQGQIQLKNKSTILQNTLFGWVVSGNYLASSNANVQCNLIVENEFEDNLLDQRLKSFWDIENRDFPEFNRSESENLCEKHFVDNFRRLECGRYQVRLPFKYDPSALGNSYNTALRRFCYLERRLKKNNDLRQQYAEFINEYIQLNHMELIEHVDHSKPHFYLPHHCVLKPGNSTTKLRVVFDGSSKSDSGKSLNEILMVGPVVQPDLFSIALRFRMYRYVFTSDITKMYRQVTIDPRDRDLQLILWRNSEDEPVKTYRLCTVTYGTSSASYLATRALNQLSDDEQEDFPYAAKIIKSDFYVDDVLIGSDSLAEAKQIQTELISMLKRGNFELSKWCSNSNELLENIPAKKRESHFQLQSTNVVKTLGIVWDPNADAFMYRSDNSQNVVQHTKRSVLSDIAQLFDPLGLVNPVIVLAKIFMKQLWQTKLSWDEPLPADYSNRWTDFRQEFSLLQQLRLPRMVISTQKKNAQIHAFADSSELAYGTCVYIRSVLEDGSVQIKLLASKSKVAPSKSTSLPRLELCAAEMAAQFTHRIVQILKIDFENIFYWTDSSIVLSWLSAESSTWKTFVSNRVATIQETTTIQQWRHIESHLNPADIISRGARPSTLIQSDMWFSGPAFLWEDQENWPRSNPHIPNIDEDLLEQRKVKIVLSTQTESDLVTDIKYITSYIRTLRVISYMNRFKINVSARIIRNKIKTGKIKIIPGEILPSTETLSGPITAGEIKVALKKAIYIVQESSFSSELALLRKNSDISKGSSLRSLAPFLDADGLIRVGGRIRHSNLAFDVKHPYLLPNGHEFTSSTIRYFHYKNAHLGLQNLLAVIRQQFWPVNVKVLIKRVLRKCILCIRCRPKSLEQLMGDLPASRVLPARPFSTVGVDFCGPFMVHYRRRGVAPAKAYVSVFICFVTRAIHLELVEDLTSAAFISALKRFIGRRGLCSIIYSDNGLNFIGARNELHDIYQMFMKRETNTDIVDMCAEDGIEWKTIPPRSPHMGGIWEAAVKSTKFHLKRLLHLISPTYVEFNTILIQIEAILNSRPLTPISNDPNDYNFLTPGHFLIGGPLTAIVENNLKDDQLNRLSRWQRMQWVTQTFWARWSSEYLQGLQKRNKWDTLSEQITIGSLVILKDENLPPLKWKMGRIISLHPGKDNVVRVVTVKTPTATFKRAITQICLLPVESPSPLQGGEHVD